MIGRNLLAMACSGLALMAVAGCARDSEVPRGSIKDAVAPQSEAKPGRPRVAGYVKRADDGAPKRSVTAEPDPVVRGAPSAEAPAAKSAVVVPAAPAAEPPMREAAAGPAAVGGLAGLNGSGSLTAKMIDQARARIAVGDVVRAREWLMSAMNGARPEVTHELGRTFDPNYVSRISQPNAEADPARARALYEEAVRLGAKGAEDDLEQLRKSQAARP